jgi:hypothetical protein
MSNIKDHDYETDEWEIFPAVKRLAKDMREAGVTLSPQEARFLVDIYYQMQERRKRSKNQVRALDESGEPHRIIKWLSDSEKTMERQVKAALLSYAESRPEGRWAMSNVGIGPVISAGLMAHIDPLKCHYYSKLVRFAGMIPGQKKIKGRKMDWNQSLKQIVFHIGECLIKFQNHKDAQFYGKIYRDYKDMVITRNENGYYEDRCKQILEEKKWNKSTVSYKAYAKGRFPDGHVHAMARRYVAKFFLAHYHQVIHELYHPEPYPQPYIIEHDDKHDHYVPPPNWPMNQIR